MNPTTNRAGRGLRCLLLLIVLAGVASAQSGRCVMKGFVVGESDYPGIAGATIELIPEVETARPGSAGPSAKTDETGMYHLEEIPHGEYTLRVSAPGYAKYEIPIYMLSDTTTELHVRLRKE